jgi:SRSO17 transposase
MTIEELEAWQEEFEQFHARFADLFERSESREQAKKYLRGLLAQADRKNSWQVAEAVGERIPDRMQRVLYRVPWDADAARDRLQQFVIETFGSEEGIAVVDETSFVKKGTHSVGVARQYLGAAGKLENGQVATVLSSSSSRGHAFLDRRLSLPEAEWAWDRPRRREACVPEEVRFETKPEQAMVMLLHAWEQGVPMRLSSPEMRSTATRPDCGKPSRSMDASTRLSVSANTRIWTERPEIQEPQEQTGGRPRRVRRLAEGAPKARMVSEVVANFPSRAWKRMAVVEGEKGPIEYHWARQRVVESRDQLPGPDVWLLARRSISDPKQIAYYLAYAPAKSSLATLAYVASQRYTVEQCIEEAKGETGLDEYEVRFWHSWYRHITFSMMAHAWLASIRKQGQEKKVQELMSLPG